MGTKGLMRCIRLKNLFYVCSYDISSPSDRSKHIALSGHANYFPPKNPRTLEVGGLVGQVPAAFSNNRCVSVQPGALIRQSAWTQVYSLTLHVRPVQCPSLHYNERLHCCRVLKLSNYKLRVSISSNQSAYALIN